MNNITYETLKETAKILEIHSGLTLKVQSGNGCYGLQSVKEHGVEWLLNGLTKKELNTAIWGIIKTIWEMKENN